MNKRLVFLVALAIGFTAPSAAAAQAKRDPAGAGPASLPRARDSRLSQIHYQRGTEALAKSKTLTAIHEFRLACQFAWH